MQHPRPRLNPDGRVLRGFLAFRLMLVLLVVVLSGVYTYTRTFVPAPVQAASASTVNFQARLLTSAGNTVPDGWYNIQFKLYTASTGGTAVWTDTRYDQNGATAGLDYRIRVVNGYLSVALGDTANGGTAFPSTINWDQEHWLTMNVGGSTQTATPTYDGEMSPRLKLTATPYAFAAGQLKKQTGGAGTTGTLDFSTLTADRRYLLPDSALATTASPATICIFNGTSTNCPGGGGGNPGDYIQNNTVLQLQANYHIQARDNGTAGTVGAIIRGAAAGQTVDLFQLQDSSGAVLTHFDSTGSLAIGSAAAPTNKLSVTGHANFTGHVAIGANAAVDSSSLLFPASTFKTVLAVEEQLTTFSGTTRYRGITNYLQLSPSANVTNGITAVDNQLEVVSGNAFNFTGGITAAVGAVTHKGTGTISNAYGSQSAVLNNSTGTISLGMGVIGSILNQGAGTFTEARAGHFAVNNIGTGTITDGYGVRIMSATNSGGGIFTNNYGLYINDQSAAGSTNSYNLYSAGATAKNFIEGKLQLGSSSTGSRINIGTNSDTTAAGGILFGTDTNLYRSAANTLATDSNFLQSGAGSFSTGSGAVSLNGATSVTGTNTFTVGTGATNLGGTLVVTGATTINNTLTVNNDISTNGKSLLGTFVDTQTTNLVANGNFETNTTGWLGANLTTFATTSAERYFGSNSLQMTRNGVTDAYAVYNLPAVPGGFAGRPYTFSFWAKASAPDTTWASMLVQGLTPTSTLCNLGSINLTTTWQKYKVSCTVSPTATSTAWRVVLRPANTGGVDTFFDGISVQYGTSGTEFSSISTSDSGSVTLYDGSLTVTNGGVTAIGVNAGTGLIQGTGGLTLSGNFSQTGTGTFGTGTGAVSLNGATSVTGTNTFTVGTGLTTLGGSLVVNGSQITNQGATLNTALGLGNFATGGSIGTAATTVDIRTTISITQTTAGQTLSLPNPTLGTAGRIVYILNTGTASFTMQGVTIPAGYGQVYIWNGSSWILGSAGGGSAITLQSAYDGGNILTTTNARNLSVTLADTATDGHFIVNVASGSTGQFKIQNNGSDTLTISGTGTLTTPGNISTTGSGTITSAGLLTGSNGLTVTTGTTTLGGALNVTGSVGIGTTTPGTSKVKIVGPNNDSPLLNLSNDAGGLTDFTFTRSSSLGTLSIQGAQVGANNIALAPTSGNVGVGVANPDTKLEVGGSSLNSRDSLNYYRNVAHYNNPGGAQTGTMKVAMPTAKSWTNTMLNITIKGYDYSTNGSWEVVVSGFNFSGASWVNTDAEIKGSAPFTQVRLAHDGTRNVILLGDTTTVWNFAQVAVTDVAAGYSSITGWGDGWAMSVIASETGIANVVTPVIPTYITAAGNLGVGTTAPGAYRLNVQGGDVNFSNNLNVGGLLTGTGGLTLTGAALLNSTGTAATTIGNATGTLTLTGSNLSTLVLGGVTLSAAELNRLDGKDAALVDVNDAVATAITGTGALTAGSIGSGFGTIVTANTITGTTLNGTTGINTGTGAGTQRIDATGNAALGTITSGLINGQTISSAANFTGTVNVQGQATTGSLLSRGYLTAINNRKAYYHFDGAVINTTEWANSATAVAQNDKLLFAGGNASWTQGVASQATYPRSQNLTMEADVKSTANGDFMFGWKNNNASNFSYSQGHHYIYFSLNGDIVIYEDGGIANDPVTSWAVGTQYRVRIVLKSGGGAAYYISSDAGSSWTTLWTGDTTTSLSPVRLGAATYSGSFEIDNWEVYSTGATETIYGDGGSIVEIAGNLGVGTVAPSYKLDVQAGTGIVAQFSGRVIGANAVNSNEFVTKSQMDAVAGTCATCVSLQGTSPGTLQTGNINISGNIMSGTNYTSGDIGSNGRSGLGSQAGNFNVAPNSSFEVKAGPAGVYPDGWTGVDVPAGGGTSVTTRASDSQTDGTYAMKIATTGAGNSYSLLYSTSYIPVKGGQKYVHTVDVKNDVTANNCSIGLFVRAQWLTAALGATTPTVSDSVSNGATTSTWTKYGGTVDAPADAAFVQLMYYNFLPPGSCTRWFDNVVFRQAAFTGDFQIQNNAGTSNLLVADTANTRIGIGAPAATSLLTVGTNTTTAAGGITFGTDTSLYRSDVNTLKTNGNLAVTGTSTLTGNVAIGTTNTTSALQVAGTGAAPDANFNTSVQTLVSSTAAAVGIGPNIRFAGQSGNAQAQYTFANIQGSKDSATAGDYQGALAFYTTNSIGGVTERMRINGAGNVGIGVTPSSNAKLTVAGVTQITDGLVAADSAGYATLGVTRTASADALAYFGLTRAANIAYGIGINSSNELIFGVTAPTTQIISPALRMDSGQATFTDRVQGKQFLAINAAGTSAVYVAQTGESFYRWTVTGDGTHYFASGAGAHDTTLRRNNGSNSGLTLQTVTDSTSAFQIQNAASQNLFQVDTTNNNIVIGGNNSGALQSWQISASTLGVGLGRSNHTSVVANGYAYVFGGNGNSTQFSKLNPDGSTRAWTIMGITIPASVFSHSSVTANGYAYVIGGTVSGTGNVATVYYTKLNPDGTTGSWATSSNPLPAARTEHSSVVANGYVYVFGGNDSAGNASSTIYYAKLNADGSTGAWSTNATSLPIALRMHSAVTANGYVYIIGGQNSTGNNQSGTYYAKFNASNGSVGAWSTNVTQLPNVKSDHTSVVANGYVYVMGGFNSSTVYYAPITSNNSLGTWATNTAMGNNRYQQSSVVHNGYIYNIGGNDPFTGDVLTITYASTQRTKIGGALDLVGLNSITLDPGGTGGSGSTGGELTAGNTNIIGNLQVQGQGTIAQGLMVGKALSVINGNIMADAGTGTAGNSDLQLCVTMGCLPGFAGSTYQTVKTTGTAMYFAVNNTYAGYVSTAGFNNVSDKTKKENYTALDYTNILDKIDNLSVEQYNYISDDDSIKHIGVYAQDFYAAFGLNGTDNTTINVGDQIGVTMAGVKALSQRTNEINAKLQAGTFANINVAGNTRLKNLTVTDSATIATLTVTGDAEFQGNIKVNGHLITAGNAPVGEVLGAIGTGGVVTIEGNDTSGTITITTGSTGAIEPGELAKATFSKTFGKAPRIILAGQDTKTLEAKFFPTNKSLTDFVLKTDQVLQPNTTYVIDYFIVE